MIQTLSYRRPGLLALQILSMAFVLLAPLAGGAQTSSAIMSDRPSIAIGSSVVGTRVFQVESGVDNFFRSGTANDQTNTLNTVLRYGFDEAFELNFNFDLSREHLEHAAAQSGLSALQVGARYEIIPESKGFVPSLALQTWIKLNSVGSYFRAQNTVPALLLSSQHELTDKDSLTLNVGLDCDGDDSAPNYLYVVNLGRDVTDKLNIFAEGYGRMKNDVGTLSADAGFGYVATPDLQLDLSGGWANNHGVAETLVSLGVSYRAK